MAPRATAEQTERAAPGLPVLDERDFRLFQALLAREAGVQLGETKHALVQNRLARRLRALGLASFPDYYRHVVSARDDELQHLLDALTTHETRFFREPVHFEFLAQQALPRLLARRGRRRLRAWSAACSTGEEAYSLGMSLLSGVPPEAGVEIELLASDLSTGVLAQARRGVYALERASEIPDGLLRRFMLRGVRSEAGRMRVGSELRALARFERFNLAAAEWPASPPFDVIFCRNVLIYFDAQTRVRVLERLLDRLTNDGYLFLGHAESLAGSARRARCLIPTVYTPALVERESGA